jgi:hypothetical protein
MVLNDIGPAEMVTLGVIFAAVALGLTVGLVFNSGRARRARRSWFQGQKRGAEDALHEFTSKISLIEHKQRVLSVYTGEYFVTFQEAGWDELHTLVENLRTIETSLRVMCEQGRYGEVLDLCDYLFGRCSGETGRQLNEAYEGLSSVENWREESRVILLRLIQATTETAHKSAEVGVARKRINRKPTLLSLADLRDSMGDF